MWRDYFASPRLFHLMYARRMQLGAFEIVSLDSESQKCVIIAGLSAELKLNLGRDSPGRQSIGLSMRGGDGNGLCTDSEDSAKTLRNELIQSLMS